MKTLILVRHTPGPAPQTEVTGAVAEAVVFGDGTAVLHWLIEPCGTEFYSSEAALCEIREGSRLAFTSAEGLGGATDAEVLMAASRLLERYWTTASGLARAAARTQLVQAARKARDAAEPPPAVTGALARMKWGGTP